MTLGNSVSSLLIKVAIPIVIGIIVIVWLFNKEFNIEAIHEIRFTGRAWIGIGFALLAVAGRDGGLAWRFRILTDRQLRWSRATNVTFLCEFTSAVTPSSVGGSALSMFFLNREGINMGRATTLTMTTLLLDELFFVVSSPLIFLAIPYSEIFGFGSTDVIKGIRAAFWIVYGIIVIWTALLFFGIILRPTAVKKLLDRIFSWKPLLRWHKNVVELTDNMVATSISLRTRDAGWWFKAFGATCLSWISRYLVVNALFFGFVPDASQAVVFGRQFVVWAILMFSPTPGGSGVSEWLFKAYYGDLISGGGVVMILALLWRLLTYYIYLLIGIFLLPAFIRNKKPITDK